ncbi:flavin-containing monooxygenase [Nocardioides sp. B-3]|uniref:flavin-containing monooxygenase n=1 Tax=Nocardioides sp. B-3 TaxID=2895565 RepID=UPI002152F057|nr:NAD(P)/FAD-dependent oxidoreductase [Nocardioides sp. B-3]UUZ60262.1 NAD(P)/FAD-dependent oxidoreductase [Nocardioides sp. B-3]
MPVHEPIHQSIVIGAGRAGLSASRHLTRRGIEHPVLDANDAPGGARQHRWDSLGMDDVHGVADLPDATAPTRSQARANEVVPTYFADYERRFDLPVVRPVTVDRVTSEGDLLVVHAGDHTAHPHADQRHRHWTQPFVPHYPGTETFAGEQLHTADYPGPAHFVGKRVLVVGGGASAVQFLGELAPVTDTIWVTRREPVWRTDDFHPDAGLEAVTPVADRVRRGLPPASVVSVTGLMLRPQEREAERLGAYRRRPMFAAIEPDGVRWADGTFEPVDVILWATGFRPAVGHLAPLHLRSPEGGIQLEVGGSVQNAVTAVLERRVQLVGYGPSASTIGANRAGRAAAIAVQRQLSAQDDGMSA